MSPAPILPNLIREKCPWIFSHCILLSQPISRTGEDQQQQVRMLQDSLEGNSAVGLYVMPGDN